MLHDDWNHECGQRAASVGRTMRSDDRLGQEVAKEGWLVPKGAGVKIVDAPLFPPKLPSHQG
ncbi:hypothetical protein VD0003_g8491 [Verticillium dahliae]|nr:hypothetical protein VD0003_g8491 [Verticillium dahliae]